LFILFLSIEEVYAQDSFNEYIEDISEASSGIELDNQISVLYYLHDNPVDINIDDLSDLLCIPCILQCDLDMINVYVKNNGRIRTIAELKLISGITAYKFRILRLFTKINSDIINHPHLDSSFISNSKQQFLLKCSRNFSSHKDQFNGSLWKILLKYSCYNYDGVNFGITSEKDAGEKLFNGSYTGLDFNSGYIQLNDFGKFKQINIGDYSAKWGEGLTTGCGFGCMKSSSSIVYGGNQNILHRYTSSAESGFYRGLGILFKPTESVKIVPILSCKSIDARTNEYGIQTLYNSGYHRTNRELLYKNTAKLKVVGCRVDYTSMMYNLGYNFLRYSYSQDLLKSKYKWKIYEFSGKYNYNTSIDYRFTMERFYLFGESAMSRNKGFAHILGANYMSADNIQFSIIYRNYSALYQSNFSHSFGENHNTQGEKGLYFGIEFNPIKSLKLNAYYDHFYFPSSRYRITGGGKGIEYLVNISYMYSSELCMQLRFKKEIKPLDIRINKSLNTLKAHKSNIRYTVKYNLNKIFCTSFRLEYSKFRHYEKRENGYLFYLDLIYCSLNEKFKCQTRLSYFNTDTYNTRIYAYENDVLYSFSFPAYFGEGYRIYTNIRYRPCKSVSCYLKYGLTFRGQNLSRNELKCQLKINF